MKCNFHVMINEDAAKKEEKWKPARSCPVLKKKIKRRHWERQEILFKVIHKKERGIDTSRWEGLYQYSALPPHYSSSNF